MTKILSGSELAHYIKERQARDVQALTRAGITPKLAIIQVRDDPVINTYVRLKKKYGADIGVEVESHHPAQGDLPKVIEGLNKDPSVNGIIIQLPLSIPEETDKIVNLVARQKDVDALSDNTDFDPATPTAIFWLLAGYNIDLKDKQVLIIGRGKLVGRPLERMLKNSGVSVRVADRGTKDLSELAINADVIITATGSPAILHSKMIKRGAVVVDAGIATEDGKTVGDTSRFLFMKGRI